MTTTWFSKFRQPQETESRREVGEFRQLTEETEIWAESWDDGDVTNEFRQYGEKGHVVEQTGNDKTSARARLKHKLHSFEVSRRPGNQTPLSLQDISSALNRSTFYFISKYAYTVHAGRLGDKKRLHDKDVGNTFKKAKNINIENANGVKIIKFASHPVL